MRVRKDTLGYDTTRLNKIEMGYFGMSSSLSTSYCLASTSFASCCGLVIEAAGYHSRRPCTVGILGHFRQDTARDTSVRKMVNWLQTWGLGGSQHARVTEVLLFKGSKAKDHRYGKACQKIFSEISDALATYLPGVTIATDENGYESCVYDVQANDLYLHNLEDTTLKPDVIKLEKFKAGMSKIKFNGASVV